jgi:prefoldin alpha subunit
MGKEVMVPLTASLYVPGVIEDNDRVLVEVGASYFVEESVEKAREYCDRKIKMLSENGQKVAEIVTVKKQQL